LQVSSIETYHRRTPPRHAGCTLIPARSPVRLKPGALLVSLFLSFAFVATVSAEEECDADACLEPVIVEAGPSPEPIIVGGGGGGFWSWEPPIFPWIDPFIGLPQPEPVPDCQSTDPMTARNYLRSLASEGAGRIRASENSNRHERMVMHRRSDDGRLESGPLLIGDSRGVTPSIPGSWEWRQVVAFTHNHPRDSIHYCNDEDARTLNAVPSVNDWAVADELVVAHHANPAVLTLYVIGCDGVLREYTYSSRAQHQPNTDASGKPVNINPGPVIPPDQTPSHCPAP
jgi:hypothetical protein